MQSRQPALSEKVVETLRLFDRPWTPLPRKLKLEIEASPQAASSAQGTFLRCARMLVDVAPDGLVATTSSGARARSRFDAGADYWSLEIPSAALEANRLEEVEDLVILALTAGWRNAGWIPLHAAAVVKDERCAILCAPSGGGKSTLTAAFARRGWRALGDDKLLLRIVGDFPELEALQRTFNLHPQTRGWFPEVGDLERLPLYSTWTRKRKVPIDEIWPSLCADAARPTHVVRVRRSTGQGGLACAPLSAPELLPTLLRQIAIPTERTCANLILGAVARATQRMRGVDVTIADDAYRDPDALRPLEETLRRAP